LLSEYVNVKEYRIDAESERRVGTLQTVLPLLIIGTVLICLFLAWKIRQYNRSIVSTKALITEAQAALTQNQEEVIRLRRLKMLRAE
jgi:hypothetical protein